MIRSNTMQKPMAQTADSAVNGAGGVRPLSTGSHTAMIEAEAIPEVALLTGGFDRPYAFGLSMALAASGIRLDIVGSDGVDSPEMHSTLGINFLNFQPAWRTDTSFLGKFLHTLRFYVKLLVWAAAAKPRIFHILWNNKLVWFDRTILMLYFRLLGKRIAFTAHNVNTAKRDRTDSLLNRITLRAQYRLVDRIFVHTEKMRGELVSGYGVSADAITVIPFGINNAVPHTALTPEGARDRLHIGRSERTILFFGRIQPYKGLEYLVDALGRLVANGSSRYRLIIAGEPKKEHRQYWARIREKLERAPLCTQVLQHIRFIRDDETELYFKAADAIVLPYTDIYQSGVLSLAYSFGLPAIAADVGSFSEEIIVGETGFLCKAADSADLAKTIEEYFSSPLYAQLQHRRSRIQDYARSRYSWTLVAGTTLRAYRQMTGWNSLEDTP
jgi:D-inositol-3-phosphate glycosyltransferase